MKIERESDPFSPHDGADVSNGHHITSRIAGAFSHAGSFVSLCLRNVLRDQVTNMASALVYTSLMALVPCLTFIFVFLGAFGVLQAVTDAVTQFMVDIFGTEAGLEIVQMISSYTGNATSLGVVGIISFIITSILLINKVWTIVNQIYHTSMNRNPLKRFAGFLTFMVVGTLMLAAYFSIQSVLSGWFTTLMGRPAVVGWMQLVKVVVPWLIIWAGLFLLIFFVPNAKVRFGSAALGSFCGMIGVVILNAAYTRLSSMLVTYSVIYGSVAVVFLFLLYMFVMWVIALCSVEIAYVHQYRPGKQPSRGLPQSPARQMSEGVNIMMLVGSNYKSGKGATTIRELTQRLLIPDRRLYGYLDLLTGLHYILPTNNGRTAFIPARPLEDLKIQTLVNSLYGFEGMEGEVQDTPGEAVALQIQGHGIDSLGNLTIENLLERV